MGIRGLWFVLCFHLIFIAQLEAGHAKKSKRKFFYPPTTLKIVAVPPPVYDDSAENNLVNQYLLQTLKVKDPTDFNLKLNLSRRMQKDKIDLSNPADRDRAFRGIFHPQSAEILAHIFDGFQSTEYNNDIVLGESGVGKTHTLDQVTALFSLGIMPDYLQDMLAVSDEELADPESIPAQFFGQTDAYLINADLLSHSPENKGQPWASEGVRMRTVIADLFAAAKKEYLRVDENKKRVGRRTIFVLDEVATLPALVNETLKTIQDQSGFKGTSLDEFRSADPGFSILSYTTPREYRAMVRGDSAVERRQYKIIQPEPSEELTFDIVRKKADRHWEGLYGKVITDEAIRFLIHNRKFLTSPPLAMPANVIRAANGIFVWKRRHPGPDRELIDLQDAQEFLMRRSGLTDVWFDGPNGEPAFHDLEERVKELFKGNDEVVNKICNRIKTWARLGMSEEVPVFILGGPTGSGKDTLVAALNTVLFGYDGKRFNFSIAGERGFGIDSILTGPPLGNHSDSEQGLLVQAMDEGYGHGLIAFNEAYDTPSEEFDKLKVLVESGKIRPKGLDSRDRPIRFPIFILGQFGEELFDGLDERQIAVRMAGITQRIIDEAFTRGKNKGSLGAIPQALLDRAKNSGGVFLLGPAPRALYPEMITNWYGKISDRIRKSNQIKLEVDESVTKLLASLSLSEELGPRALRGLAVDFTEGAISAAQDDKLPMREIRVRITTTPSANGTRVLVQHLSEGGVVLKDWSLSPRDLSRFKLTCAALVTE